MASIDRSNELEYHAYSMNMLTAPREAVDRSADSMDLERNSSAVTTEHSDITEANKTTDVGGEGDKKKRGWKNVFGGWKRGGDKGKDKEEEKVETVSVPERVAQLEAEMLTETTEEGDGRKVSVDSATKLKKTEENDINSKSEIPVVSLNEFMGEKKKERRRFLLF